MPFLEALSTYTDLHSEITGAAFRQEPNGHAWERVIGQIGGKALSEIAQIVYTIYREQPHASFDPQ